MTNPATRQLAKFLSYILGRHPDEFGLVTDVDGYVKIKDLLKALSEEEGWRHVRQAHLNEIVLTIPDAPIEVANDRIRAGDREHLPRPFTPDKLPKLLYTCVRPKAHPVVLEHGVSPIGGLPDVVMATEAALAMRMGRRYDASPLPLTVQTDWAVERGVVFRQFGDRLFLSDYLPVGAFIAPPLPKELAERPKKERAKKDGSKAPNSANIPAAPKTPGSFVLEVMDPDEKKKAIARKKRKEKMRDKEKRRIQKQKRKQWDD